LYEDGNIKDEYVENAVVYAATFKKLGCQGN